MTDMVNHPAHYKFDNGVEVIDLTEQLTFNTGNAVKYLSRAGRKSADPIEDLRKARWYVDREILRIEKQNGTQPDSDSSVGSTEEETDSGERRPARAGGQVELSPTDRRTLRAAADAGVGIHIVCGNGPDYSTPGSTA
ncbi:hypothetical protein CMP1-08 [Clavibacter phage CMP1]|uniref:DUF3310 domain-containing protein n=1 Tax=Clavibacter phage CMP1 TaxID=686439 RepID=D0U1Z2_9CAUD|nr:nucleotide kinase [Clavibacter phage CMP1]ACY35904.1 hypothetical protein CMP1-08 [Clavibacter phage CMP1]